MESELSPALIKIAQELRRSLEAAFRADMARDMVARGIKPPEVARVMGVSRNTVYRYLRESDAGVNGHAAEGVDHLPDDMELEE